MTPTEWAKANRDKVQAVLNRHAVVDLKKDRRNKDRDKTLMHLEMPDEDWHRLRDVAKKHGMKMCLFVASLTIKAAEDLVSSRKIDKIKHDIRAFNVEFTPVKRQCFHGSFAAHAALIEFSKMTGVTSGVSNRYLMEHALKLKLKPDPKDVHLASVKKYEALIEFRRDADVKAAKKLEKVMKGA